MEVYSVVRTLGHTHVAAQAETPALSFDLAQGCHPAEPGEVTVGAVGERSGKEFSSTAGIAPGATSKPSSAATPRSV
jgi:hypothetical protein